MAKKLGCVCDHWCRVDHSPEQVKSRHHKNCAAHSKMIDVVKIQCGVDGNAYFDKDIKNTLLMLVPEVHDEDQYLVTFTQMTVAQYDDLPEFEGF